MEKSVSQQVSHANQILNQLLPGISNTPILLVSLFRLFSCVHSNVSLMSLLWKMHTHTACICLFFLQCVFSYVTSNCLLGKMHSHTGCKGWTLFHCVFSNVPLIGLPEQMHSCIGCICTAFLLCVFSNVSVNCL